MRIIDLRSDTVTKPSAEMRRAIYEAEVGDDVYKEDPTVIELENYAAELLGKEAALFVPSGVMANQICLNVLTSPADEVICHKDAHIFHFESGTPAANSGIQLFRAEGANGILDVDKLQNMIRPKSAYYMPRTRVVAIENTHNMCGGIIQPIEKIQELYEFVAANNLYFHLDGARLWNAVAETDISAAEYSKYFDTVSVCLSKGLGAPIGSIIASDKGVIEEAFRIRKAWGGGMRQAGIIAAAGLYALKNNISRLKEDHEKAKIFAQKINEIDDLEVDLNLVQTNIIMFKSIKLEDEELIKKCKEKGLLISHGQPGVLRAVTHLDVNFEDIEYAGRVLEEIFV